MVPSADRPKRRVVLAPATGGTSVNDGGCAHVTPPAARIRTPVLTAVARTNTVHMPPSYHTRHDAAVPSPHGFERREHGGADGAAQVAAGEGEDQRGVPDDDGDGIGDGDGRSGTRRTPARAPVAHT